MALQDVKGVFSQFFVVGFFAPAFFMLVILRLLIGDGWLPDDYREASGGAKILILGGAGLLVALLLSGLHHQVLRLYAGYGLRLWPWAYNKLTTRWADRFEQLETVRDQATASSERTEAARQLDDRFPSASGQVLPTRLGNVMRAFESHPRRRYNLNGVMIWPRIEMLMSETEYDRLVGERTNLAFLINSSALASIVGAAEATVLVVGASWAQIPLIAATVLATIVASWILYWFAVDAAIGYGYAVRSGMDLHRTALYERLGAKVPTTQVEEKEVANAINRCLRFGEPLPDHVRAAPPPTEDDQKTREEESAWRGATQAIGEKIKFRSRKDQSITPQKASRQ